MKAGTTRPSLTWTAGDRRGLAVRIRERWIATTSRGSGLRRSTRLGWSVVCSTFGRFTTRLGLYARWAAIQDAG